MLCYNDKFHVLRLTEITYLISAGLGQSCVTCCLDSQLRQIESLNIPLAARDPNALKLSLDPGSSAGLFISSATRLFSSFSLLICRVSSTISDCFLANAETGTTS